MPRTSDAPFDATGRPRISQLINKSNQFNLTTRRYTESQVAQMQADPQLLTVVFHRLVDNALKFGRPGVRPRVDIRPAHDEQTWRVRITDNGVGVPASNREKVFGMFHRLHGEERYPGVGAGLAICRRIARRHGGEIRFVNQDEGACVELALPRPPHRPNRTTPKAKRTVK